MLKLAQLALCASGLSGTQGFNLYHKKPYSFHPELKRFNSNEGVNSPVFVSEFLPNNAAGARNASKVNLAGWDHPNYAGFITIDKPTNSNMFFWLHEALDGNKDAPILLWLQGGPGVSSMFGAFTEIGPFNIDKDMKVVPRDITWNQHYHLLFIDNPLGTGFSFTESAKKLVKNQTEVGLNLYSSLLQFFQVFPSLQGNDFYVTGESYAGKYVPACAYTIHEFNKNADQKINLKGVAIGDGAFDPANQFQNMGNLIYYLGMIDENELQVFKQYEGQIQSSLAKGDNVGAFHAFDEMLNGDFYPYGTYYANVTGMKGNYFNFELSPEGAGLTSWFVDWLRLDQAKNALHVGEYPFAVYNATVERALIGTWMVGVTEFLVPLLENYKVNIYSGQNDIILGGPLTEQSLRQLSWSGQKEFLSATKKVWHIPQGDGKPDDIGGYVRSVGNFRQVLVRGAGHMVPEDQPARAFDMITRFIDNKPF
jgi:vitellogenic carboxypeptidase-like protein